MNEGFPDQVKNFARTHLATFFLVTLVIGMFSGGLSATFHYDGINHNTKATITRQQADLEAERSIIRDQLATIRSLANRPTMVANAPFVDVASSAHRCGTVECLGSVRLALGGPRGQWTSEAVHLHLVRTP